MDECLLLFQQPNECEVDKNHHVFLDIFNRAGDTSSASARHSAAFCLYAPPGTASGQDGIRATDD